jgi:hypothetical protein
MSGGIKSSVRIVPELIDPIGSVFVIFFVFLFPVLFGALFCSFDMP